VDLRRLVIRVVLLAVLATVPAVAALAALAAPAAAAAAPGQTATEVVTPGFVSVHPAGRPPRR